MSEAQSFQFQWGIREWDNHSFTKIPNEFLDHYAEMGISNMEALLIMHMARFHYNVPGGISCPSLRTLGGKMNLSVRSVRRIIGGLKEKGLEVRERPGYTSIYDYSEISERCHFCHTPDSGVLPPPDTGVPRIRQRSKKNRSNNNISNSTRDRGTVVVKTSKKTGINKKTAEQIVRRYGPERVSEGLENLSKQKNVNNPGGWLVAWLQGDWKSPERLRAEEWEKKGKREETEERVMRELEGKEIDVGGRRYLVQDGYGFSDQGTVPAGEIVAMYESGKISLSRSIES